MASFSVFTILQEVFCFILVIINSLVSLMVGIELLLHIIALSDSAISSGIFNASFVLITE